MDHLDNLEKVVLVEILQPVRELIHIDLER